ncbi:MAG: nitrophenyl compound nitroreductase subunit ArsF family protein [Candidatus Omnitrophica bacterium]|nr:nitrophenyl compound nitroreductase subunit ArsF family protein [Candidatus Omnitrophota bacterium]
MKRSILTFLIVAVIISSTEPLPSTVYAADEQAPSSKVIAYYFHGRFRCPTCYMMEQYAKEAIENNFKDALASGKLEFKVVNVEVRGNEHFINDYQLYTKALVLSLLKDGKEVKSKNLTKIWEYVRNKQRYFNYVTEEVNSLLKEVP